MTAVKSTWVLLLLVAATVAAAPPAPGSFGGIRFSRITAAAAPPLKKPINQLLQVRGGAVVHSDVDEEEYDSEYDEDEEEPIVSAAKKLAASTRTVAQKKKTAAIKSKVKVAMAASSANIKKSKSVARKTSGGSLYKRYVPYIVRACVNPFTLFAMTKAYFVSLFDINYLKEDDVQTLRSALQEKARTQQPSSGSTKPKPTRKMKPGQAKTLSDLPQLSA